MISKRVKNLVFSCNVILFVALFTNGQNSNACLIDQPVPQLPKGYGTLDAQTSVMLRVEFLSSGTLGKVALVKSAGINQLDDLATETVNKIRFKPKQVKGSPITTFEILIYRYSWQFSGWRVERLKSLKTCPTQKKSKSKD